MELPVLHHQAATGGTIISKCLSQMPNIRLLSEVEPNGRLSKKINFEPTALISQYFSQYGELDRELINDYFLYQVKLLIKFTKKHNTQLILRDHNHPDFMMKKMKASKPLLTMLLNNKEALGLDKVNSVVTIRHPVDSFLGCKKMNWTGPINHDFDIYCSRLLSFSNAYASSKIFKYEDFCVNPDQILKNMCEEMKIMFDASYKENIKGVKLTGDSGRSSSKISLRKRRDLDKSFIDEIKSSESFEKYCLKFDYELI